MRLSIQKWGNSASVRLPALLLEQMGVGIGSELTATITQDGLVLRPKKQRKQYNLADLLAKITPENKHNEIDCGAPVGKEQI
ncbi:AbrB/MazE/SpoVT family DNA-binding domain-containing protein [uncultured Deefgea sp.]|uniref:AbrB/MazE/SpoVT family DNA-binding domain-containing protein n=1 Tax=uncultured Deefgea sp. TaxID=1304914 RepID=UPI0026062511|nr:AbrB/MazE/SpoVT family DNA-binding domain-containing protein [uncultured Deefgea sp.]